jgi:hypothetical protein
MSLSTILWQGTQRLPKSQMDIYHEFILTNPSEIQFERFLFEGINFYFLTRNDIPEKYQHIYNDVQRIKNYLAQKMSN